MEGSFFKGRELVIATMHGKESVIAPLLEENLGVKVMVPKGINTDYFGTFSGEIERYDDPVETARKKCQAAASLLNAGLVLASEGSFGPHPAFFFTPADDELLLLMDFENRLEVKVRELSTQTNFGGCSLKSLAEVEEFALKSLFPAHGLIVRKSRNSMDEMTKGIHDWIRLNGACEKIIDGYGEVYVETDMRAMHNPSRMKVIESATSRLVATLKRNCPACGTPGFDITGFKDGLLCEHCGMPTRSILSHSYGCQKCGYEEDFMFPKGKMNESPMFCDYCNP